MSTTTKITKHIDAMSDEALIAFVDFIRLNSAQFTRDPSIIRRVFAAYVASDRPELSDSCTAEHSPGSNTECVMRPAEVEA